MLPTVIHLMFPLQAITTAITVIMQMVPFTSITTTALHILPFRPQRTQAELLALIFSILLMERPAAQATIITITVHTTALLTLQREQAEPLSELISHMFPTTTTEMHTPTSTDTTTTAILILTMLYATICSARRQPQRLLRTVSLTSTARRTEQAGAQLSSTSTLLPRATTSRSI